MLRKKLSVTIDGLKHYCSCTLALMCILNCQTMKTHFKLILTHVKVYILIIIEVLMSLNTNVQDINLINIIILNLLQIRFMQLICSLPNFTYCKL